MDLPPKLILPEKPAIIRPADALLVPGFERGTGKPALIRLHKTKNGFIFFPPMLMRKVLVSYTATPTPDTVDRTTYTFSTASIGTAANDRIVVVGFCARANAARSVSSATIGGAAATLVGTANDTSGGADIATMWLLRQPTGTTATMTVTFSNTMLRCSCFVWAVYGSTTTLPAVTDNSLSGGVLSVSASARPNGALIGVAWSSGSGSQTIAWGGLTEDAENQPESGSNVAGAAHALTSTGANINVTATIGGTSPVNGALVVGTFAP